MVLLRMRFYTEYVDQFGTVDYERWQREQPTAIAQWISTLKLNSQSIDEPLAFWINLYMILH